MAWLRPQALILRGLPGAGKSHFARRLCDRFLPQLAAPQRYTCICTTDDFFETEAGYCFEPQQLGEAHAWNRQRFASLCDERRPLLICANTNMERREWQPYAAMAEAAGYRVRLLTIGQPADPAHRALCLARNLHGVDAATIEAMASRFSP